MSDWKSRAKPAAKPASDWRSRATALGVSKALTPGDDSEQFSKTESALAGAAQGVGYDFLDELYGARKGAQDVLVGDSKFTELPDRYRARRDEARKYYADAQKQNPVSYGTGNVAGGVGSAFIPGYNLARGGKLASAALSSGVAGLGASEGESTLSNLRDAGVSAGTGAALTGLAGKLLPTGDKLQKYARGKAVTAAGASPKEIRALRASGLEDSQGEWLLKNKVVTPLASLEDISKRSDTLRETAGKKIGSIVDNIDSLRVQAIESLRSKSQGLAPPQQLGQVEGLEKQINNEFGYKFDNVAQRIEDIISRDDRIAASKFHRTKIKQLANEFRRIGSEGPGTIREGLQNKTQHRRLLKDVDSLGEDYKQEIYDIISDELNKSVDNTERLAAGVDRLAGKQVAPQPPGQSKRAIDEFKGANRDYAAAATTNAMAEKRLGNTKSNRDFGLTSSIALAAGLMAGGPVAAVAYGGANNFFRKYGSALQATGANKLAQVLKAQPQSFGKYAVPLEEALRRGPRQFLITNYLIGKNDPQYVSFLEQLMQGEDQ